MHNHIYSHAESHSYFRKLPLTRILKMNCGVFRMTAIPKAAAVTQGEDQDLGQERSEDEEKQKL